MIVMLTLPASGCMTGSAGNEVFCTPPMSLALDAHAAALLTDGTPDAVVVTGDRLVAGWDAACG